ncbi:MAG: hypothetical protein P4M14_11330 [Gammaproteobacteria bacterium]|nr:hypothetical protein [Gammaproteobacteria bacterium]
MSSQKTVNNIYQFEKNISRAISAFLVIAFLITTVLFVFIFYQDRTQQNIIRSKAVDSAFNVFDYALSEKLSIIADSNIFIDFLSSGYETRKELEPQFLMELLPLNSDGVVGYTLVNLDSEVKYYAGTATNQFVTIKLCYLASRLDSNNGNCSGLLKLYFSESKIIKNLLKVNNNIRTCNSCKKYNFVKGHYLGSFPIQEQNEFGAKVTIHDRNENLFYFYLIIVAILFGFSLFYKIKLRKVINVTISRPLDVLVNSIKNRSDITLADEALEEISYLSKQIQADREQISKINDYEKKAAVGLLAAEVAHDIQSPLAVMEIAMANIANDIPSKTYLILKQAVQSMRDISNNLLKYYRQSSKIFEANSTISLANIDEADGNIVQPLLLSLLLN